MQFKSNLNLKIFLSINRYALNIIILLLIFKIWIYSNLLNYEFIEIKNFNKNI